MTLRLKLTAGVAVIGLAGWGLSLLIFGAPHDTTVVRGLALSFAAQVTVLSLALALAYQHRYYTGTVERREAMLPPWQIWGMGAAFLAVFLHTAQQVLARWENPTFQGATPALLIADFFSLLWLVLLLERQAERTPEPYRRGAG